MKRKCAVVSLVVFVALLALQGLAAYAYPVSGYTRIYEGIEYATGYATSPRTMRAFALRVSLKNPDVGIYASHSNGSAAYETALQTTPAFLSEHGLKAAINASFFNAGLSPNTDIWGLLVSNGTVVSAPDYAAPFNSYISFTSAKDAVVSAGNSVPTGCYNAVAGAERLLTNGAISSWNTDVQPRTAVGLTADGKYAIMVCVDGRQPGWSEGVSHPELAQWLLDFEAYNAILLDGGGSTTMVRADAGTVNSPCYGYARSVGANLGVTSASYGFNNQGPDSVSWDSSRMDIFTRGAGNHLCQKVWRSGLGWSDWYDQGGNIPKYAPGVCTRGVGILDCFVVGSDNALYQKTFENNTWSGFTSMGNSCTSAPAAVAPRSDRMDVFVQGSNGHIYQKKWLAASGWGPWYDQGLAATSGPAACSRGEDMVDVFARGPSNQIWYKSWDGSTWSAWTSIGGSATSDPAVVAPQPGRMDVFIRQSDNHIWQRKWTSGAGWGAWYDQGCYAPAASAPSVSSRGADQLDVFYRGSNDHLYLKSWYDNAWHGWFDEGTHY